MDRLTRLLLQARDGDQEALARFISMTQHEVYQMCRVLGDPDSVEDLTQESYERAIASLHRFRADGPARHWLLTITRRTCADATRRRVRRRRLDRRLADHAIDQPPASEAAELDDLLHRLDIDRRSAFVLTQVIGLRYEEAAEILDCPVGTIRSRVARARRELSGMLAGYEDGQEREGELFG